FGQRPSWLDRPLRLPLLLLCPLTHHRTILFLSEAWAKDWWHSIASPEVMQGLFRVRSACPLSVQIATVLPDTSLLASSFAAIDMPASSV
ncbi:unnamed protein product, partial [Callosobruchus maculatus]